MDDLLIRGDHVVDGSGAGGRDADVAIGNGRIVAIEPRSTRCGIGSCGVPRPSLGGYVTGTGPMDRVTAAGGRSCCPLAAAPGAPGV